MNTKPKITERLWQTQNWYHSKAPGDRSQDKFGAHTSAQDHTQKNFTQDLLQFTQDLTFFKRKFLTCPQLCFTCRLHYHFNLAPLELELEQCDWHKGALLLGKHAWQPKRLQEYLCISEYTITGQKSKQITRIYGFLLLILLCVPWLDCKVVLLHSSLASTYHWRCSVSAISETKTPLDSAKLQPLRSSSKRCLFDSSLVEVKAEFSNY